MKRIFTFSMLLLLMASCKKIITNELLTDNKTAAAKTNAALSLAGYRWIKALVPTFSASHAFKPEGDNLIIRLGKDLYCVEGQYLNTWYKFNDSSMQWTLQSNINTVLFLSSANPSAQYLFSYNSKVVAGLAYSGEAPYYVNDYFASFEPIANIETRLSNFPGIPSVEITSFVIGNKGYIMGGRDAVMKESSNQLWEYDFLTNQWSYKGVSPLGKRADATVIVSGGKAYMGFGYEYKYVNGHAIVQYKNDWVEYDPATSGKRILANFPGQSRAKAKGFILDQKAYVGFGYNGSTGFNDFWKYDPTTNAWTVQPSYPGSAVTNRYNTNAFTANSEGYVVKGDLAEGYRFTNAPL